MKTFPKTIITRLETIANKHFKTCFDKAVLHVELNPQPPLLSKGLVGGSICHRHSKISDHITSAPSLQPLLVVRPLSCFVLLRDNDDKTRALPLAKHDPSVCPLSSELVVYNFVTCTRSWRGRGWGGGCWSCEVVVGLTAIDGRVSHAGYFYPWVWLRAIGKRAL